MSFSVIVNANRTTKLILLTASVTDKVDYCIPWISPYMRKGFQYILLKR